jgi:hypothetical protein
MKPKMQSMLFTVSAVAGVILSKMPDIMREADLAIKKMNGMDVDVVGRSKEDEEIV